MVEEASLEFRLTKIDETRNHFLDEIKHNDLMDEKYKKTSKYLNYVKHLLILASTVTGCVSVSAFASICKKYKSIIKKKKKKHDKIVLFGKDKLNIIEVLISKASIDSYISHDEFVSVNNVLRECN